MYQGVKVLLRISAGLILLMIGILGIMLPVLPGLIFILIALPLISPIHGERVTRPIKEKMHSLRQQFKDKK